MHERTIYEDGPAVGGGKAELTEREIRDRLVTLRSRDVWIDWRDPDSDWHGYRVLDIGHDWATLAPIDYVDPAMGPTCGDREPFTALFGEIASVRPLHPSERASGATGAGAIDALARGARSAAMLLGGEPIDDRARSDAHYRALGCPQPIEIVAQWATTWDKRVIYAVSEAVMNVARHGTRGQAVRDLRKAAKLLEWAALVLEGKQPDPRDHFGG